MQGFSIIQVGNKLILTIDDITSIRPITSWTEVSKLNLTQEVLQEMKDNPNCGHWVELSNHFEKTSSHNKLFLAGTQLAEHFRNGIRPILRDEYIYKPYIAPVILIKK